VVEDLGHALDTETDCVTIDNQPVNIRPKQTAYLLLNKPAGVLSSTSDKRGRRTIMDILPDKYRHLGLHPVGRLDKDTTGLLLMTNDGELTYRLTHPKFEHEKEYLVSIRSILQPGEKRMLEQGIILADGVRGRCGACSSISDIE
jgi:23S rRNA pseudouridine2605 synthase